MRSIIFFYKIVNPFRFPTGAGLVFTAFCFLTACTPILYRASEPDFAPQIGQPSSLIITLNTGRMDFPITFALANAVNLTPANIQLSVAGGGSCTVSVSNGTSSNPVVTLSQCTLLGSSVSFKIVAGTASSLRGKISLESVASVPIMVVNGPSLAFTPLANAFGSVPVLTNSNGFDFTLSNSGTGPAAFCAAATLTGASPGDFEIYSDSCGTADLALASSCIITVRAKPTSVASTTATLSRTCGIGGVATTTLNALATSGNMQLGWSTSISSFGEVKNGFKSGVFPVYFQNKTGLTATSCNVASLTDTTNFEIVSDACGASDASPFSSCVVGVRAKPQSIGSFTTHLLRTCNGTPADLQMDSSGINLVPLSISAGDSHNCMILSGNTVYCFGSNDYGQVGNGGAGDASFISYTISNATQVSNGMKHSCAIMSDTSVKCWGEGDSGQLGNGTNTYINGVVPVSGLSGATQISSGKRTTCAIMSDTTVKCWGDNSSGQYGNGTTTSSNIPVAGPALTGFTQIATGSVHSCGLLTDQTVRCWGNNSKGQLGNGTTTSSTTPVSPGLASVSKVVVGQYSSCALLIDQTVKCWGSNSFGQIGGVASNYLTPTTVTGLSGVTQVALGSGAQSDTHFCAIVASGNLKCLGSNSYGQLGDGTALKSNAPVSVLGITGATQITLGNLHSCAILSTNQIKCWGSNGLGQFGNGITAVQVPVAIPSISTAVQVVKGDHFTCALLSNGSVQCWGANDQGQLGDGTTTDHAAPTLVPGMTNVTLLTAGGSRVCAQLMDSTINCWGENLSGALGLGDFVSRSTPTAVPAWGSPISFGSSSETCMIYSDHSAKCAGQNTLGQLGDGTANNHNLPTLVTDVSNVDQISTGYGFGCGRVVDGSVSCWGNNGSSALGDGTGVSRLTGAPVLNLSGVTSIVAEGDNACALIGGGNVKCWGLENQNGDGTPLRRNSPSSVSALPSAVKLSTGNNHACALLANNTVQCWGKNDVNQLGTGDVNQALSPRPVYGLTNIHLLWNNSSPSSKHSCVVKNDGSVWCWGANQNYQASGALDSMSEVSGF